MLSITAQNFFQFCRPSTKIVYTTSYNTDFNISVIYMVEPLGRTEQEYLDLAQSFKDRMEEKNKELEIKTENFFY